MTKEAVFSLAKLAKETAACLAILNAHNSQPSWPKFCNLLLLLGIENIKYAY